MSESRRDVALLDSLAVALDPPAVEPSAESLFRLRIAVAEHHGLVDSAARPTPTRTPWWRRPWAVASLATGMALAGTSTAMATGAAPMPRPVRVVAHAVGLPVDSPDVADVRHATEVLKKDLATPSGAMPAPSTAADAQKLQRQLVELSPSDRSRVGDDPHRTLDRATSSSPTNPSPDRGGSSSSGGPSQQSRPSTGDVNPSHKGTSAGDRPQTSTPSSSPATTTPAHSTTPTSEPSSNNGRHRGSGDGGSSHGASPTPGGPEPHP